MPGLGPERLKDRSPFYPDRPVPPEAFIGRAAELERMLRAGRQVSSGKPQAVFVRGEYGAGKTSLARAMRQRFLIEPRLATVYVPLATAQEIDEIGGLVARAFLEEQWAEPRFGERLRNLFANYVGDQTLLGMFTLHLDKLRADGPTLTRGMLPFLVEINARGRDAGYKGLMVILDEINGLADTPEFARLIKGLYDANAMREEPIPLLLVLCGTRERWDELVRHHPSIDRIFEIVDVSLLSEEECRKFYTERFRHVGMSIDADASATFWEASLGLPKLMHVLGDAAFWIDTDGCIDSHDAIDSIKDATITIGRKLVKPLSDTIHDKQYRTLLGRIRAANRNDFKVDTLATGPADKKLAQSFLSSMRDLDAAEQLDGGFWRLSDTLVYAYIRMLSREDSN